MGAFQQDNDHPVYFSIPLLHISPCGMDVCQKLCQLDDDCLFWRHDNTSAGTKEECLFISTDYHQDCKTLAGPVSINLEDCVNVDQSSCDAVIPEICNYSGDRLTDFEFGPGETSSIQECQEVASALESYGVKYFVFLQESEECQLYAELVTDCQALGGPAMADCS